MPWLPPNSTADGSATSAACAATAASAAIAADGHAVAAAIDVDAVLSAGGPRAAVDLAAEHALHAELGTWQLVPRAQRRAVAERLCACVAAAAAGAALPWSPGGDSPDGAVGAAERMALEGAAAENLPSLRAENRPSASAVAAPGSGGARALAMDDIARGATAVAAVAAGCGDCGGAAAAAHDALAAAAAAAGRGRRAEGVPGGWVGPH